MLTSRAMRGPSVAFAAAAMGAQRRSVAASAWGHTLTSTSVAATLQNSKTVEMARTATSADCQPTAVQQTEPSSLGRTSAIGWCWLFGSPFPSTAPCPVLQKKSKTGRQQAQQLQRPVIPVPGLPSCRCRAASAVAAVHLLSTCMWTYKEAVLQTTQKRPLHLMWSR